MQMHFFDISFAQALGAIPGFLHPKDNRPARDQLNERYAHGGGWSPMGGWSFSRHDDGFISNILVIQYPDDPPYFPLAVIIAENGDRVWLYHHAWVAIEPQAGEIEVARLD